MTRDWTPSDQADAEDDRRHREWWKRPDPFDPNNEDEEDDPTPGSDAAVERGCTCPIGDNARGWGAWGMKGAFWITEDCPLHGPKEAA